MASSRTVPEAATASERPLSGPRLLGLALLASGLDLALDGITWLVPLAAPPHLLLRHAPDFVRQVVGPLGVSIAASIVWGLIGVLALLAVEPGAAPRARRARILAALLWGLWLLSEGLLALVWLDAPWAQVLGGLAAGLPRSAAVAWALTRVERR